jgi:hypothetical protein
VPGSAEDARDWEGFGKTASQSRGARVHSDDMLAELEVDDSHSMLALGVQLYDGVGVEVDRVAAVVWCREPAEPGNLG